MTSILIFHIFTDPADADFSAAILVKLAVNVEKTPSVFFKPKVSVKTSVKIRYGMRNHGLIGQIQD